MISNHTLQHVVTLAEHGNFRRAANALNITQPNGCQAEEQTVRRRIHRPC